MGFDCDILRKLYIFALCARKDNENRDMEDRGTQNLYEDFIARFRELREKVGELESIIDGQIADMEEILSTGVGHGAGAASDEDIPEASAEDAAEEIPLRIEIGESLDIVPLGEAAAKTDAVVDRMAARESWRTDMPGTPVNDIRSAISLNDRIIFINTLFGEDPVAFKETLSQLNGAASFEDGVRMVLGKHPEWNTDSETVYRFMMAVRRKLK